MYSYFHKTELDEAFYSQKLKDRLPARIIDAHAHFNLAEHVSKITPETIAGDWALECGLIMTYEDACAYTKTMFPDRTWEFVALPWPLREADTHANNAYIAQLVGSSSVRGLYTIRPEFLLADIERDYRAGKFSGFKPYPYMANAIKGADISIFEFMPHEQFELADRLGATVLMHLPRAGRFPDPDNIAEIKIILQQYKNIKLVLAHFGRCFQPQYLQSAFDALGNDLHRLWFDCSAVLNPEVYKLAFNQIDSQRILFGTDLPIFLWHGKRTWDEHGYHNLCREDFSWNTHPTRADEDSYTYYVYEQMNNILSYIGNDTSAVQNVFFNNAAYVYKQQ